MYNPFGENKAKGFQRSITPRTDHEAVEWQNTNKNWWEKNPMRYDFRGKPIEAQELSPDFFREVDRRFLRSVKIAFPWKSIPFDNFIDFEQLKSCNVLEIGVGMGTHAVILSSHARSYTGIDLTEYAVRAVRERFDKFGCNGRVMQMDAEQLFFPDTFFDFVWSWGVIHHSSDTKAILRQIHRVLKPGGKLTFMVYHQSPWNTFFRGWLYYGLFKGGLFKGFNAHQLIQMNTDGALARYYTTDGLKNELDELFEICRIDYLGNKLQIIPLGFSKLKERMADFIPNSFGRWLTNRPFFAYMMVATVKKRSHGLNI